MFDFYKYVETFNTGDDKEMLDRFWVDDLVVLSGQGEDAAPLASGKDNFLNFFNWVHDGVREIMRVQTLIQEEDKIFAEIDFDFHASKERPDYPIGHLKQGELVTVKMFALYFLRGDKIEKLKLATWPPNVGVTKPPARNFGPPPPTEEEIQKAF